MDTVEILLLGVVGCSVFVFLVIENLESNQKSRKKRRSYCDSKGESWLIEKSVDTIDVQESVGAGKEVAFEMFKKVSSEEEGRTEDPVDKNRVKSGSCCEVSGEDGFLDDDWEGVERTELERLFGEAVNFVDSLNNNLDVNLMLELYGLQKVAFEGACHGSQPMALKISARSKWNAWQKLGDMSRETAMEKYVDILSKTIPNWKGETIDAIANSEPPISHD